MKGGTLIAKENADKQIRRTYFPIFPYFRWRGFGGVFVIFRNEYVIKNVGKKKKPKTMKKSIILIEEI